MTKVRILTNCGYGYMGCQDAIGKVFDAEIVCTTLAREYGICITSTDGVVYDGRWCDG